MIHTLTTTVTLLFLVSFSILTCAQEVSSLADPDGDGVIKREVYTRDSLMKPVDYYDRVYFEHKQFSYQWLDRRDSLSLAESFMWSSDKSYMSYQSYIDLQKDSISAGLIDRERDPWWSLGTGYGSYLRQFEEVKTFYVLPKGEGKKYLSYSMNERLKSTCEYKSGKKHGEEVNYYSVDELDDNWCQPPFLKSEGQYKSGNKHGTWKYYDKTGTVIQKEKWNNGVMKKRKYS